MGNGRTRTVSYTPRMTDLEAYELLWPAVREALATCPFDYSALWALNQQEKLGQRRLIEAIRDGAESEARKGFVTGPKKIGQKRTYSGVRPLWTRYR